MARRSELAEKLRLTRSKLNANDKNTIGGNRSNKPWSSYPKGTEEMVYDRDTYNQAIHEYNNGGFLTKMVISKNEYNRYVQERDRLNSELKKNGYPDITTGARIDSNAEDTFRKESQNEEKYLKEIHDVNKKILTSLNEPITGINQVDNELVNTAMKKYGYKTISDIKGNRNEAYKDNTFRGSRESSNQDSAFYYWGKSNYFVMKACNKNMDSVPYGTFIPDILSMHASDLMQKNKSDAYILSQLNKKVRDLEKLNDDELSVEYYKTAKSWKGYPEGQRYL